jgi:hypothetical protein
VTFKSRLFSLLVSGLTLHCGGIVDASSTGSTEVCSDADDRVFVDQDRTLDASRVTTQATSAHADPRSCKTLLHEHPGAPSGFYLLSPDGRDSHLVYCDMDIDGGGWTRVVYPTDSNPWIRSLIGSRARQMLKCSSSGTESIILPVVSTWSWSPCRFASVAGTWIVNSKAVSCGKTQAPVEAECQDWFGVGCSNGAAKIIPGVSLEDPASCFDHTTAHAEGVFSICGAGVGSDDYAGWVVFLREED